MTDSIARGPEAAADFAARALEGIRALLALVDQRGTSEALGLASLAALELVAPLSAVELSAEALEAWGDRKWMEGFRAGREAAAEEAATGRHLRLASNG
jgi:hypothetical protein